MNKEEIIKEALAKKEEFIFNPNEFLYECLNYDVDDASLIEGLRIILLHNKKIVQKLADLNQTLTNQINIQILPQVIEEAPSISSINNTFYTPNLKLTEFLNRIPYLREISDFEAYIQNANLREALPEIKLYLLNQIKNLKKQISALIIENYLNDISLIQDDINRYELFLNYIQDLSKPKEQENSGSKTNINNNIILLPNRKNSTYIYDDINKYVENAKEIKISFDKIINGYFLQSKSTKSIISSNEKLYEYTSANGIRILYIINGEKIFICSLFYKDKNKSTKITSYYEEAAKRYQQSFPNISDQLNSETFQIEQLELLGEIYGLLEQNSLKL